MLLATAKQRNYAKRLLLVLFLFYAGWWLGNLILNRNFGCCDFWGNTYQVLAFCSSMIAFILYKVSSHASLQMRRIYLIFGFGLFSQFIGQNIVFFLLLQNKQIYPSIADIFFLASGLFYLVAILCLRKVVSINKITLGEGFFYGLVVYSILLMVYLYIIFNDSGEYFVIILDALFYGLEALYVIIGVLLLFSLRKQDIISKTGILIIVLALVLQFMADTFFVFLYDANIWLMRGFPDILYLESFFLLGYGLIEFSKLHENRSKNVY